MDSKRIAVLGAGPMGLAVAYQLALDGYIPVVFEADDRVGGMTACFDFSGVKIERYYHFHCTSDNALFTLLEELDLADHLCWTSTRMGYYFQGRLQNWGDPWALLTFSGLSLLAKIRYGLHAFFAAKRNHWQDLDKKDAVTWIRSWVGEEAYRTLWQPLFQYKFYHYTDQLSAAWIWSRIRRIGRSRYHLFKEKLGYLTGGSNTLLDALKNKIEALNGEILLKTPVQKVVISHGKVQGIQTNEQFYPFERVISTIPLPYVPQLMPDLPETILQQFKAIHNIAVVCVIVKLKRALTDYFWLNINNETMDIPGLVEYTNLQPIEGCHIVYIPFYMPGDHPHYRDDNAVFLHKVKRYLMTINPDLIEEDFIELRASRYRFAQPICSPEFLKTLPPVALPIKGLWVADTSYYYPEDRGISESVAFGRKMAKDAIL
ncbi:hypothetical protein TPSD3_04420 [Thioflexithrix psekupsensis]|uniref:Amine oxidase domain-containing protein n=1 Tax=Thioflexithrix psekupsensis TaxID=1570016 RepID=A0A251XA21_9GAMM|nr:hypothetical protein TPSD3_04420 [Thioflexithrix psekupsensis]